MLRLFQMKPSNKHELALKDLLPIYFGSYEFIPEYRFDVPSNGEKARRWRFDFACPYLKVAFEVEGGTWSGGRHVNPIGFEKDCEKYNKAIILGWKVFRLVPKQINEVYLESLFTTDKSLFPYVERPDNTQK